MAQSAAVRSPVSRSPSASVPSAPAGGVSTNPSAPPPDSGPFDIGIARERRRGRGTLSNVSGRYEPIARIAFDDGWQSLEELPPFATTVSVDSTRKIITRNESPDISFDRSINPYRGCEHGCVYCFARPTHAYLGLSPGLDFETKLFAKPDAPALLEKELSDPKYQPRTIAIGTNTDPYQPIERKYQVMRGILEVLERAGHPVGIVTKSALILRDLDILTRLAERNLVKVALSVTTLDPKLARTMEPRAATPGRRLEALRQLSAAGIPMLGDGGAGDPGHQRYGHRAHPRRRRDGGRQGRRLCAASPAARGARPVRRMAPRQLPRPRRPCDEACPRHARRQGLRLRTGAPA